MSLPRPYVRNGTELSSDQLKWVEKVRDKLTQARVPADRIEPLAWKAFEMRFRKIGFRQAGEVASRWIRRKLAQVAAAVTGQQIADPTQTSNLRNEFARKLRNRVRRTIRELLKFVSQQDMIVGANVEGIISREAFEIRIRSIIQTNLMGDITDLLEDQTRVTIDRAVRKATRDFARAAGIRNQEAVDSLQLAFGQPISPETQANLVLSQTGILTRFQNLFTQRVLATLGEGIQSGESIQELQQRIQDATNFAASRAETIARTETIRVFNQAAISRFQRHGIRFVEWITAGDERVDPDICEPLEGERFILGTEPDNPAHPRCRCSWLPVIPGT